MSRLTLIRADHKLLSVQPQTVRAWKHRQKYRRSRWLTRYLPGKRRSKYIWIIAERAIIDYQASGRQCIADRLKAAAIAAPACQTFDPESWIPPDLAGA